MDILTIMFFLGIAQLIWAAIHASMTDVPQVRKHFINYAIGVVIYFIAIIVIGEINVGNEIMFVGFLCLFFGGAFGLACYHLLIVCMSFWLGWPRSLKNHTIANQTVSE